MTFYGSYDHSIDERGRVAVPARFRRALQDGAILRASPDGCIELYSSDDFQSEVDRRLGEERSNREVRARRIRRSFLTGVFDVDLDRQGRVLVPQALREAAALSDRVVIAGCGDYVEMWSPDRWAEEEAASHREEPAAGGAS